MILATLIVCITLLIALHWHQDQERYMKAGHDLVWKLEKRVSELEKAKKLDFDQAAFDDLKSKVESLRISIGLKGSR